MQEPGQVALFIDFENIRFGYLNATGREIDPRLLISVAKKYGYVNKAQAYADFSEHPDFFRTALEVVGIRPMDVPKGGSRQNKRSADMAMLMDIFECLVDSPNIGTLVLMTGDSDFIRIVAYARNRFQKQVVIVGVPGTVSNSLVQAADGSELLPIGPPAPAVGAALPPQPAEALFQPGAAPAGAVTGGLVTKPPVGSTFEMTPAKRHDMIRLIWIMDYLEKNRPFVSFKYVVDYATNPGMPIHTESDYDTVRELMDYLINDVHVVQKMEKETEDGPKTHYFLNRDDRGVKSILGLGSVEEALARLGGA